MHCTMIIFIFVMIMSVAIITVITMTMTIITMITMTMTMITTTRQKHNAIIADLGDQIDQLNKGGTLYMIVSVFC